MLESISGVEPLTTDSLGYLEIFTTANLYKNQDVINTVFGMMASRTIIRSFAGDISRVNNLTGVDS